MTDFNAHYFEKLYSKMAWALGAYGRESDSPPDSASLWWSQHTGALVAGNPGIFISSRLDARNKVDDAYGLALMLDVAPSFDWVLRSSPLSCSAAYRTLLDYAEFADGQLHPHEQQKLMHAERQFDELRERYSYAMQTYIAALDGYQGSEASFRNGSGPSPTSRQRGQLRTAYDRWIASGKCAIEMDAAIISQYAPMAPGFQQALRTRFDDGERTNSRGETFYEVHVEPPCRTWSDDDGWENFNFSQKDLENQTSAGVLAMAGGLDAGFGLFRVSSSGDYSKDGSYRKVEGTSLNVSCQLKRVSVDRPWLHPLAFSNRRWRWKKGSPMDGQHFSTGGSINDQIPPQGPFPLLSTSIILCRNLQITGTLDAGLVEELNRRIKENASVGFGPFSIAGAVHLGSAGAREVGTIGPDGIEVKAVQIIAQGCRLLPKSPEPYGDVQWPT